MSVTKRNSRNRMLVNATQQEEVRVAIVNDNYLENVYIEQPGTQKKGNIYKGKVTRIEPSLQAAFVDFGSERHGFLPVKEVAPSYYQNPGDAGQRISIDKALKEGQEVLVQIDKDERGNKGAALTTYVSLAGSYLVLMPNNPRAGGISRRIEGDERDDLKETLNNLQLQDGMGIIVRTAGVGKSLEELQWDLDILTRQWEAIEAVFNQRKPPFLVLQESDVIIRAIRDHLRKDIDELIIDNKDVYERASQHISRARPEFVKNIKHYQSDVPLFSHYRIEQQIESAYQSDVRLPSGGSIVIQGTEALVSIDVNSSKNTKGADIEQTAFNTNTEAAIEVARQLRLRDVGGLVVVDFIDMVSFDNQREVVNTFLEHTKADRARVQCGRISKFGLLEISRQRLRPSLMDSTQMVCPRCSGEGTIRSIESMALFTLRLLREDARQDDVAEVHAQLPISVATYLINEKRRVVSGIEKQDSVTIRIIPNPHLETPNYKITRIKESESNQAQNQPSYKLTHTPEVEEITEYSPAVQKHEEAAIKDIDMPIKPDAKKPRSGIMNRLKKIFSTEPSKAIKTESQEKHHATDQQRRRHSGGQKRQRQGSSSHRGQQQSRHNQRRQRSGNKQRHRRPQNQNQQNNQQHNQQQQRQRQQQHHKQAEKRHEQTPAPVVEAAIVEAPIVEIPQVAPKPVPKPVVEKVVEHAPAATVAPKGKSAQDFIASLESQSENLSTLVETTSATESKQTIDIKEKVSKVDKPVPVHSPLEDAPALQQVETVGTKETTE